MGAGNTTANICQDLAARTSGTGRGEVAVVRRASMCMIPVENKGQEQALVQERLEAANGEKSAGEDAGEKRMNRRVWEVLPGLERAGLRPNNGWGGSGCFPLVFERFGGTR
ncbi:hypothetical protein BD779DRAFT_1481695 [Infundibulicybe gibba]|nr:hypothetical protein BD779DRAFT_1481695 [Infundibulicybe gibba]